jgi:hypothetical protein
MTTYPTSAPTVVVVIVDVVVVVVIVVYGAIANAIALALTLDFNLATVAVIDIKHNWGAAIILLLLASGQRPSGQLSG